MPNENNLLKLFHLSFYCLYHSRVKTLCLLVDSSIEGVNVQLMSYHAQTYPQHVFIEPCRTLLKSSCTIVDNNTSFFGVFMESKWCICIEINSSIGSSLAALLHSSCDFSYTSPSNSLSWKGSCPLTSTMLQVRRPWQCLISSTTWIAIFTPFNIGKFESSIFWSHFDFTLFISNLSSQTTCWTSSWLVISFHSKIILSLALNVNAQGCRAFLVWELPFRGVASRDFIKGAIIIRGRARKLGSRCCQCTRHLLVFKDANELLIVCIP